MPASVAHQSFWDRVPNASTMVQLLNRKGSTSGHHAKHRQKAHPCAPLRDLTLQQPRVSKRKQSHPMRSPQAIASPGAQNDGAGGPPTQLPAAKARRMSLDGRLPQLLRAVDAAEKSGSIGAQSSAHTEENGGVGGPGSRAFRLSFSDDYLRNPQEYVQALIDSEALVATPIHKSHSSASHSRSRRSTHGGGSRSRPSNSSSRRNRSGRFHNLQLEQTVFAAQLENEDTNSVTTTASDINDLADIDGQVPGTPMHPLRNDTAVASEEDEDSGDTKSVHEPSEQAAPKNDADDTDKDDVHESRTNSQPDTPAAAVVEQAADGQNVPSYERLGQTFGDGTNDDLARIAPSFARSTVKWNKADPIDVTVKPMADKLSSAEQHCCSVLRILPEQYLAIKHTLLKESRSRSPGSFKKRDAQRLCRIDVNKTSKIYEWYVSLGWLAASNGVYALPPEST
ncbi:hypothetical protein IW140_000047 [Coemansia sp. RSA 1813]|nr:hypothetical protein EV178_000151 [Coemansia sp. RSA 1646]KAJ1771380.1 hypothetical protein LPJ74_002420 [Coemansia sp. RSA 1843]KAJ2093153.1 hypothetical protein IW138_000445 [Coemansia sp. RSA 986]KAJ2217581.1 hypothetical protein EV179_000416 [Coemansia sp. RSA 487]KAJ2573406.1 hypothetical protein IW140_000047 [Coemansia sp. RSA 1813]